MMADELVERGLDFIERVNAESGDPDQMERDYTNAIKDFERANVTDILQRARIAKKHVRVWDQIRRASANALEMEQLASAAAKDFLSVGMVRQAARLCEVVSGTSHSADDGRSSAASNISKRLLDINDRWRKRSGEGAAGALV